jgi:hypothetical protein
MNDQTESLDSILCEFNDIDTPPDLSVRPIPAPILRPFFRRQLFPESAFSRRKDLGELSAMVRQEHRACLDAQDSVGASYCLGNLAVMAKVSGHGDNSAKLAKEAQELAAQVGLAEVIARMQILQQANGA